MNKKTRTRIAQIKEQLDKYRDELETMQEDEQDKYDNLPEGLQESERGEAMMEAADNLENAVSALEECIDALDMI